MATGRKKVVVRRFSAGAQWGYVSSPGLLSGDEPAALDLLDLGGRVQTVPLADVKYVAFVRDFNTADAGNPERLMRKIFAARPRAEGLWLALTLTNGERIEGLASLDITFADGWGEDRGVYLVPPDVRGNTQRLFIPRIAIASMETLAVVTTPSRKKAAGKPFAEPQPDLFSQQG